MQHTQQHRTGTLALAAGAPAAVVAVGEASNGHPALLAALAVASVALGIVRAARRRKTPSPVVDDRGGRDETLRRVRAPRERSMDRARLLMRSRGA